MGGWVIALLQAFEIAKVGAQIWDIIDNVPKGGLSADERAQIEAIISRGKAQLYDTTRDV